MYYLMPLPPEITHKQIGELTLDPKNPRLPESLDVSNEDAILEHMRKHYDLLRVARSIARHGYYESEPLIVLPVANKFIVLEGNRRLAALKTLINIPDSESIDNHSEWSQLSKSAKIPQQVPVLEVKARDDAAPIVGYRHIAGIEPWDPWAKARFIGRLIDEEHKGFEEVALIVAESVPDVRAQYRNYRIVVDGRKLKVDTSGPEGKFGVFTRAMNAPSLREFVGARDQDRIAQGKTQIDRAKKENLEQLFGWLFGGDAAISESRDISRLAKVLSTKEGTRVLRDTGNLAEAELAAGGVRDRLLRLLQAAHNSLEKASTELPKHKKDPEVAAQLNSIAALVKEMREGK